MDTFGVAQKSYNISSSIRFVTLNLVLSFTSMDLVHEDVTKAGGRGGGGSRGHRDSPPPPLKAFFKQTTHKRHDNLFSLKSPGS